MKIPTYCPYCQEEVSNWRMRDERIVENKTPMKAGKPDPTQDLDFQTTAALLLIPCGHKFYRKDLKLLDGKYHEIKELGDRVINPITVEDTSYYD